VRGFSSGEEMLFAEDAKDLAALFAGMEKMLTE
jgi:hypothetical protein